VFSEAGIWKIYVTMCVGGEGNSTDKVRCSNVVTVTELSVWVRVVVAVS